MMSDQASPPEDPGRPMSFTVAELAFAASLAPQGGVLLRAALSVPDESEERSEFLRAGFASLRLRDWIVSEGTEFRPVRALAAFASVVDVADVTYRVAAVATTEATAFSVMCGPGSSILLRPSPDGVVSVSAIAQRDRALDLLLAACATAVADPAVKLVTIEGIREGVRDIVTMRWAEEGWRVMSGEGDSISREVMDGCATGDVIKGMIQRFEAGAAGEQE